MNPIDPAELSALLDGELPPDRAAQVRGTIDADPALQAEFQRLSALDARWFAAGASAAFQPRPVSLTSPRFTWPLRIAALLSAILLIRFVPKFLAPSLGMLLHFAALVVLLAWTRSRAISPPQLSRIDAATP